MTEIESLRAAILAPRVVPTGFKLVLLVDEDMDILTGGNHYAMLAPDCPLVHRKVVGLIKDCVLLGESVRPETVQWEWAWMVSDVGTLRECLNMLECLPLAPAVGKSAVGILRHFFVDGGISVVLLDGRRIFETTPPNMTGAEHLASIQTRLGAGESLSA